jgi:hypothetical protein
MVLSEVGALILASLARSNTVRTISMGSELLSAAFELFPRLRSPPSGMYQGDRTRGTSDSNGFGKPERRPALDAVTLPIEIVEECGGNINNTSANVYTPIRTEFFNLMAY